MNQLYKLFAVLIITIWACDGAPQCPSLTGGWTNHEGQDIQFKTDGSGLWLVRFGSSIDTTTFRYAVHCTRTPIQLDITDFSSGPFRGKSVYGIIEWSSDTSFRFRFEAGVVPDVRPSAFDSDQTQKFFSLR